MRRSASPGPPIDPETGVDAASPASKMFHEAQVRFTDVLSDAFGVLGLGSVFAATAHAHHSDTGAMWAEHGGGWSGQSSA